MIHNLNQKIETVNKYLKEYGADGLVLYSPINRSWFLNFESSYGWLLINQKEVIYIVDARYYLEVCHLFKDEAIKVWKLEANLIDLLQKAKNEMHLNKILIEADYLTLNVFNNTINKVWNNDAITSFSSANLRAIKYDYELQQLQASADLTVNVFEWIKTIIKPGMTEKEVAKLISIKFLELGAQKDSFDPIVAANLNGANPHHKPSDYKLQDGDMVTLDLGCMYNNYASDMTRTIVLGKECNNQEVVDIYNLVLSANELGVKNATNKISGYDLDLMVRNFIDNTKYKGMFSHGLGHGVGLEVHELPNANASNKNIFPNNAVITVEPGIYCANVGGVRIEDTLVIHNNEPIVLTKKASKELTYVDYQK